MWSLLILWHQNWGQVAQYQPVGMKVLNLQLANSDTTQQGGLATLLEWPRWKSRLPIDLTYVSMSWVMFFSVVFGWSRAGIFQNFSVLLGQFFPDPLLETTGFCWNLFLSIHFGISESPGSSAPSLGYLRQKENTGISALLFQGFKISNHSTDFSPLLFFQCFLAFGLYEISRVFSCT